MNAAQPDYPGEEVTMSIQSAEEPVPLSAAVVALLEQSDRMDGQLRLRLAAYREGWAAAELARADDYERGYRDGLMALKRVQHEFRDGIEEHGRRWGKGGRAHFADPRPGDYPGGSLPLEMPGHIWLAGPTVHYHQCTEACRSYEPGWYKAPDTQGGAA